jgi:hypothetical protein
MYTDELEIFEDYDQDELKDYFEFLMDQDPPELMERDDE